MSSQKIESRLVVIASLILLCLFCGCGSSSSVDKSENYVQYAKVNVDTSIVVSGRLINANEELISIVVDGALVEYDLDNIESYEIYMAPDPHKMQQDVVLSTSNTAGNTGFFVVLTMISLIFVVIAGLP